MATDFYKIASTQILIVLNIFSASFVRKLFNAFDVRTIFVQISLRFFRKKCKIPLFFNFAPNKINESEFGIKRKSPVAVIKRKTGNCE